MGVVYKLTQEVIDFILQKKKLEPSISVRKLADMASQQFQTNISKSSVSTLLKDASLNSSVGRPSKMKEEKTGPSGKIFKIPEKRKQQLRENVVKAENPAPVPKNVISEKDKSKAIEDLKLALEAFEKPQKSLPQNETPALLPDLFKEFPSVKNENKMPEAAVPIEPKEEILSESAEAETAEEELIINVQAKIDLLKNQRRQRTRTYAGAGIIFFKAMEWMISKEPLLPKLIVQHYDTRKNNQHIQSWDALVSLHSLGIRSAEQIKQLENHSIWLFHHKEDPYLLEAAALLDHLEPTRNFLMDYDFAKSQMGMQVSAVQIVMQDGKMLACDPHLDLLKEGQKRGALLPFYQAMRHVSECLVSNQRDMIFNNMLSTSTALSGNYRDLIALCDNMEKIQIKSINILDDKNQNISEITAVPHKRRNFIFGLGPQNQEFKDWEHLAAAQNKTPFYCEALNSTGYFVQIEYVDAELKRTKGGFRVIYFWAEGQEKPLAAILTNHGQIDAETLLNRFLSRYLIGHKYFSVNDLKLNNSDFTPSDLLKRLYYPEELNNMEDVLKSYEELIWRFCWQVFFGCSGVFKDINHLKTILYDVRAEVFARENKLFISLIRTSLPSHVQEIQSVINIFNASSIQDKKGRRIVLSLLD